MQQRRWLPEKPVDVRLTLAPHRRGTGDPTYGTTADGALWRTSHTPDGPGTLRVAVRTDDGSVEASAWGLGAAWLLDALPAMLGSGDEPGGFAPAHPLLREIARRRPGLRIGRTTRVMEALVPAILEQKVTGTEAWRAWRGLLWRYGESAPGPAPDGMYVVPPASTWRQIPSWAWHRAGVERRRARTVAAAATVAGRLEETAAMPREEAQRRLRAVPGVGVWTVAEVMQRAHGDADAVSVGDYHLPGLVGWALTGEHVDDDGMLELLAPYAGHRYRVTRLLELGGPRPPRRGPRMAPRDIRAI